MLQNCATIILIAHACIILTLTTSQHACHEESSCLADSISTSTADVQCYGYLSCSEASILTSDPFADVDCDGSYSCYKATQLTMWDLNCGGLLACAFIDSIFARRNIYCYGEGSCYGSRLYASSYVQCKGVNSCAETIIYAEFVVYGYGYSSLRNSQMISNSTTTYYRFFGLQSGKGATVTCNIGHTCYISCYSNACNELSLSGNGINVDCKNDAYKSDVCPNGHVFGSFINDVLPNLTVSLSMFASNNNKSYSYLYDTCDIQCGDYYECQTRSLTSLNLTHTCCTGAFSCQNVRLQYNDNPPGFVHCDSYGSCSSMSGYFQFLNGTDVYGSGDTSVSTANMYHGKNLYCTARYGCSDGATGSNFYNFTNIYCMGYRSCSWNHIESVENVFVYGAYDQYMQIYDVKNTIYCNGYLACSNSTIGNVNGDVYVSGLWAMGHSMISHVLGSVIGIGYEVLKETILSNVTNVCYFIFP